jgi:hypothetical protein
MLSAVQFDHQFSGRTGKIDDASPYRMLPAKTFLSWQLAQCPPQALFCLGCVMP